MSAARSPRIVLHDEAKTLDEANTGQTAMPAEANTGKTAMPAKTNTGKTLAGWNTGKTLARWNTPPFSSAVSMFLQEKEQAKR